MGHLGLNCFWTNVHVSKLSCSSLEPLWKGSLLEKKNRDEPAFAQSLCRSLPLLCSIHLPFQKSPNRNGSNTPSKLILGKAHQQRRRKGGEKFTFGNVLRKEQIKKEMKLTFASCFNLALMTMVLPLRRCVCKGSG